MARASRSKLVEGLLKAAAEHARRPALRVGDTLLNYEQLVASAAAIAMRLTETGAAGDRTAVLGRKSSAAYAAFLGSLISERVYLPLSPHDPAARHAGMLTRGRCRTLIADRASLSSVPPLAAACEGLTLLIVPDAQRAAVAALDLPPRVAFIAAEDLAIMSGLPSPTYCDPDAEGAYLIFTSGSTGTPKGVLVPGSAARSYVESMAPLLGLTPKDQVTQVFDPGFDLSLHDMIMCWDAGACLTPLPAALQFRPGEAVRALGINVWFSVPSTISVMAGLGQLKPELLGGLRLSLFCGEALNMRDVALWNAAVRGGRILNLYGPTEATIAASAHEVTERDKIHLTAPIGQPLPHVDYVLLDPESGEISEQVEGELGIAGAQLAIGYWDDPELTAKRFPVLRDATGTRRVYRTGDRVTRIDGAGYLYLGRLDNEIKIAGAYRLNLLEVESAVVAASGARSCAVVVSEGRSRARSKLTAFVVDARVSDQEIREFLRQNHPIYMIPETIRRTPALPVLPNGKVDRRALTRLADAEVEKSGTC